ncbi:DsbC family protein [Chitinimonas arctica]|uniref:Thiol:disulfide interchange protein n=1 Tax=Chitinimonas arctica TaxID=2594795 RepID=A0A516SGP2_9NEIS|nr:DsbC family protein [Chitinimonas arctica]QDQ27331.1 DsbC family protein [Chitinimonas arctica]
MTSLSKRLLTAAVGLALVACANAAGGDSPESVKVELKKKFPDRQVESVRTTPVKGLYEVVFAGRQVIYSDARADYILVGDMVDVKSRSSLTEARIRELSKTDFNALPLDKAIKLVRGTGARKVAVFSDPDCPFCKKIEQETLSKLDNVTIYTFLYPLTQLHPDAPRKSALIWCAADKQKAWEGWMFEGKLPEGDGKCPTPLADIETLTNKLGISGTPAMVFENGEMMSGAIPLEAFEAKLSAKK